MVLFPRNPVLSSTRNAGHCEGNPRNYHLRKPDTKSTRLTKSSATISAVTSSESPQRSPSSKQERPVVPTTAPTRFRRIASSRKRWGLTRTLSGYRALMPSVGGKAPKWVLTQEENPEDFII